MDKLQFLVLINISKKELAAKLQTKSNDLIRIDVPEKFARQDVDKTIRAISIIQASCSEETGCRMDM